MYIQHNMASINATRNQGINHEKMKKTLEKLSTGYRINRAGDDAAGLAISELMRNQIRGLDQAMRNVNDGIGMTNTGEGALEEIQSMLQRMQTLAIQAANGTYNSAARANIDAERLQLMDEIDRIGESSDFDDIPLFAQIPKPKPPAFPKIIPPMEKDQITLQIGHTEDEILDVHRFYMGSEALGLDKADFTSVNAANKSVDIIETAIAAVSEIRASFGAANNHLEHTHNSLSVTHENMTSAESRIRDTDLADQYTEYTKQNIMQGASEAMTAQANTLPEMIMRLLQ